MECFTKHINELTVFFKEHEREILLTVIQYQIISPKSHQKVRIMKMYPMHWTR